MQQSLNCACGGGSVDSGESSPSQCITDGALLLRQFLLLQGSFLLLSSSSEVEIDAGVGKDAGSENVGSAVLLVRVEDHPLCADNRVPNRASCVRHLFVALIGCPLE